MSRRGALSPVGRETLHDRVYAELRRSLIHGMFDAGEMLRIQELAETLQTSTMPVREALGRLVSEQALEALPNRSVRVPVITRERLDDLARARCLIEGQMVALALPNLAAEDFARLRQLTAECEAAFRSDDPDKAHITSELNHAFHFYIYRAAGSAVLIPIVESLWLQSGPYVRAAAQIHDEQRDIPATHHHWALIEALERGDDAGVDQGADRRHHPFLQPRSQAPRCRGRRRQKAATMADDKDDSFELYDLRVEVTAPEGGPIYCGAKVGDHFELRGEMLHLPPGQGFSIYSLAAVLPLLPAKQRPTHTQRLDDDGRRGRLPRPELLLAPAHHAARACAGSAMPRPRRCRSMTTETTTCSESGWRRTTKSRASSAAAGRWPAATARCAATIRSPT